MSENQAQLARPLFTPKSIALVGASDDLRKPASRPQRLLRCRGFPGKVYPVNPRRAVVQGEPAWPSLAKLPEVPDHAFVMVQNDAVASVVAECAQLGVPLVTVLADGFGRARAESKERQSALQQLVGSSVTRLLGPGSLGVVAPRNGMALTANAAFLEGELPHGHVLAVSHSGSMIGGLFSRGRARGIGFAGLVSVGAESDLSIGEICACTLEADDVTAYVLFLETVRHADALRSFASAAAQQHKPVMAYVLGRTQEAAELAQSHTGALVGETDAISAFLADCGIAQVHGLDTLLEGVETVRRLPISHATPRVGVVTTTGGGGAMIVDQLALRGIPVSPPRDASIKAMQEAGVDVAAGRIVDLTLAGSTPAIMRSALGAMASASDFDMVVAVVGSSAALDPELAVRPVVEVAGEHDTPIVVFVVPHAPVAVRLLAKVGLAAFTSPENCADAIAAATSRRQPCTRSPAVSEIASSTVRTLDEIQSHAFLAQLGITIVPTVTVPAQRQDRFDLPFAYPVAAKAVFSPPLPHKSEVGGVVLEITTRESLCAAVQQILRNADQRAPHATVAALAIQPMLSGIAEALVGYRLDPRVGPLVTLAAGGLFTEIYKDRSVRMAPVDSVTAQAMIDDVAALTVLKGYRGVPPGDLAALSDVVVRLSALAHDPTVREAEINPVIVRAEGEGAIALDALVRVQ